MTQKEIRKKGIEPGRFFLHVPSNQPVEIININKDNFDGEDPWKVKVKLLISDLPPGNVLNFISIKDVETLGNRIEKGKVMDYYKNEITAREDKQAKEIPTAKKTNKLNQENSNDQMKKQTVQKKQKQVGIPEDPADEYIREEFGKYEHNQYAMENSEPIPKDPAEEQLDEYLDEHERQKNNH